MLVQAVAAQINQVNRHRPWTQCCAHVGKCRSEVIDVFKYGTRDYQISPVG